jgi:formylglycine-generating enzyme required for sulfatase activity
MAGNVWEWCLNEYGDSARRVLRGGSWFFNRGFARCACRNEGTSSLDGHLGLRLVCVAPIA